MSTVASDDEVLEKMLMEAQRLALRMRSSTHSVADASHGSFLSETDHADQNGDANIVSCDSNHSQPGQVSKISLNSYFDKINQQDSQDSRASNISCEEKSYASVASAQQDAIAEAIKATQEMEQTLRALSESPSGRPVKEIISLRGSIDSQHPGTLPVNARQNEMSQKSPHHEVDLNSSSGHISWEKVDPIKEDDDDFVPIVDYTSPKKKSFPRDESEIKWERITSPDKDEDDYVPIADYTSRAVNQSPMQRLRGAILPRQTSRGSGSLKTTTHRSSRKKRRKFLKVLALVVAVSAAVYWLITRNSSTPAVHLDVAIHPEARELDTVATVEAERDSDTGNMDFLDEVEIENDPEQVDPLVVQFELEGLLFREQDVDRCSDEEMMLEEVHVEAASFQSSENEPERGSTMDPAEEEIICLFGGRCSEEVKERRLFSRNNIEILLASMMQ